MSHDKKIKRSIRIMLAVEITIYILIAGSLSFLIFY
jgi:hypothetical protein